MAGRALRHGLEMNHGGKYGEEEDTGSAAGEDGDFGARPVEEEAAPLVRGYDVITLTHAREVRVRVRTAGRDPSARGAVA